MEKLVDIMSEWAFIEWIGFIVIANAIAVFAFYYIVKAAVRNGTKEARR